MAPIDPPVTEQGGTAFPPANVGAHVPSPDPAGLDTGAHFPGSDDTGGVKDPGRDGDHFVTAPPAPADVKSSGGRRMSASGLHEPRVRRNELPPFAEATRIFAFDDARFRPQAVRLQDTGDANHVVIVIFERRSAEDAARLLKEQHYVDPIRVYEKPRDSIGKTYDSFDVILARSTDGHILGYMVIGYSTRRVGKESSEPIYDHIHSHALHKSGQLPLRLAMLAYFLDGRKNLWEGRAADDIAIYNVDPRISGKAQVTRTSSSGDPSAFRWPLKATDARLIHDLIPFTPLFHPVGGGSGDPPAVVSPELAEVLLPARAQAQVPFTAHPARLDGNRILALALGGQRLFGNTVRFDNLGDTYRLADGIWKKINDGIHTWDDLESFVGTSFQHTAQATALEVEIDQYNFPTLNPPRELLERLHSLALRYPDKPLTLVVKGHPMDPPAVFRFTPDGVRSSLVESDDAVIRFWAESLSEPVEAFLASHSEHGTLYNALAQAHSEMPTANLGEYLERVRRIHNQAAAGTAYIIPDNQRTQIYARLEELRRGLNQAAVAYISSHPELTTPPAFLYWNFVDSSLRRHPADTSPQNAWFSIGAGQMAATLEFPRRLMDRGFLPLDFRLMATDIANPLIWEINTHGTNTAMLGRTAVNPQDHVPIYVMNGRQRDEALLIYRPGVVLLNLKAAYLAPVMDERFVKLLGTFRPVLVTPAKAYDNDGRIPYLEVYRRLAIVSPEMARRFLVMGGFFSASAIFGGQKIDMTIAGESEEALGTLAHGMSPTAVDKKGRADWEFLNLKLIVNKELAAALQAGGANKNFLTYRSARLLLRKVLSAPSVESAGEKAPLMAMLEKEKDENIEAGEEITARLAPSYGISTYHLWSPGALGQDFKNCLPQNIDGLISIRNAVNSILLATDATTAFRLVKLLVDHIRRHEDLGTRNARDGFIDEALAHLFRNLKERGVISADSNFEDFYREYYPADWTGAGAQEGRNGIGPVIRYAVAKEITLPGKVYEAWNLYHPETPLAVPSEEARPYDAPKIDETWGLAGSYVEKLGNIVENFYLALVRGGEAWLKRTIHAGLGRLEKNLATIRAENGRYPEITRRLLAIRERVEILVRLFGENEIEPARFKTAVAELRKTFRLFFDLFTIEIGKTTELLAGLRKVAQSLYRTELEIHFELKARLGLAANDARPAPVGAAKPASGAGATAGSVNGDTSVVISGTHTGGSRPGAGSTGPSAFLSGGLIRNGGIITIGRQDVFGGHGPPTAVAVLAQKTPAPARRVRSYRPRRTGYREPPRATTRTGNGTAQRKVPPGWKMLMGVPGSGVPGVVRGATLFVVP